MSSNRVEIIFGSDHAGYELKNRLCNFYALSSHPLVSRVHDAGCFSNERVDYPDYAKIVATIMKESGSHKMIGVLVCGTGIGIGIAANRFDHIRCALCTDTYSAEMSRKHNDANCVSLGARRTSFDDCVAILETFLSTEFEGGRHERRLSKINHLKTMLAD
jgi:ribose 5-phosphate isomerase B